MYSGYRGLTRHAVGPLHTKIKIIAVRSTGIAAVKRLCLNCFCICHIRSCVASLIIFDVGMLFYANTMYSTKASLIVTIGSLSYQLLRNIFGKL